MPLCAVKSERSCNTPENVRHVKRSTKRRTTYSDVENAKPCNRRVLSKCTWQFYHQPDQDNFGPQLIVTEPDGKSHYLMDPETFMRNLRWHSARLWEKETSMLMTEEIFEAIVMGNMHQIAGDGYDDDCNKENQRATTAQAAMTASTRWKARLRGGIVPRWKRKNCSSVLPFHHTFEGSVSLRTSDGSREMDCTKLLGFHGSWSSQGLGRVLEEASSLLKLFGILGSWRKIIANCCSLAQQH